MLNTFIQGGQFMWILLILAIVNIILSVKKGIMLFSGSDQDLGKTGDGIHAILFWGIMAAVIGFYAHFTGIYFAMQAIMAANDISQPSCGLSCGGGITGLHMPESIITPL